MKALVFLLLLDYSGSMDQALQGRTKIQILKEETTSLLSTGEGEVMSLVFGTNPHQGCRDVRTLEMPAKDMSSTLQSLRPGALGKTPLATSLHLLVRKAIKYDARTSVVVTDGADSCGQDPCKALQAGDKELGKVGKKLKVHIIGFDLKNEGKKFACFKDLKLENIDVSMSEASSSSDLQRRIREGQMDVFDVGASLMDKDTSKIQGLKKNAVTPKNKGVQGQKNERNEKSGFDEKSEALVEIVGAPSTARFSAISKYGKKDWQGSYVMTLKAGPQLIRFDDSNGTELNLELGAGTQTKIPWARLMKIFEAQVELESPYLSIKWVPTDDTKAVHGEVVDLKTRANLNPSPQEKARVPFGDWSLEVTSPPWLEGKLQARKMHFDYGKASQVNLEILYQDQIKWVDNPRPDILHVLKLTKKGLSEERYPIEPGVERIPIPKDFEAEWITP